MALSQERVLAQVSAFQAGLYVSIHTGSLGVKDTLKLPYRLFIPKNYDPKKTYPLVLAMHGAGERGLDDSIQLTYHKLATLWIADSTQARHPSFVLAPQCPPYPEVWVQTPFGAGSYSVDKVPIARPMRAAVELLDSTLRKYSIDTDRVYVAGLSMGGYATWDLLVRNPHRFAAAVPICGGGDTSKAGLIKHVPIWAFHGDSDHTVPVKSTREMIAALRKAGGSPKYTEYPGVDHGSWGPALNEPALPEWLYAQKRTASAAVRPVAAVAKRSGKAIKGLRMRGRSDRGTDAESLYDGLGRAWPVQ